MGINGVSLVAESDGEPIADSSTLRCLQNEMIMILEKGEVWQNVGIKRKEDENREEENSREGVSRGKRKENDSYEREEDKSDDENVSSNSEKQKKRLRQSFTDDPASDENIETSESGDRDHVQIESRNLAPNNDHTAEEYLPFPKVDRPFLRFDNFEIQWDKFTCTLKQRLNNKTLKWQDKRDVINGIVEEMRDIKKNIPKSVLSKVAEVLVDLCPKTFEDRYKSGPKEGERMGKGTATTIRKMRDCNNYLNRPHNSDSLNGTLKVPLKSRSIIACWMPKLATRRL